MEGPSNGTELKDWIAGMSDEEAEMLCRNLQNKNFKCWNQLKQDHLELSWKPELSEDATTLKYEESESGLYYECPNILEYIQDCRYRKNRVASEVIRDFELIHKNNKQKLFLWVSELFEPIITTFSDALKDFLAAKSTKRVSISTDKFEDRYIILTNIIVDNYDQKVEILNEFKSTLTPKLAAPLAVYFDNKPEPYEKIPSVANEKYKNPISQKLKDNNYELTIELKQEILDISICYIPGSANDMSGNIYLVREREFCESGELTYKIGKTQNGVRRLKAYPKGSKLFLFVRVKNAHVTERYLINLFKKHFQWRKEDRGSEYFTGDVNKMMNLIWEHRQLERW